MTLGVVHYRLIKGLFRLLVDKSWTLYYQPTGSSHMESGNHGVPIGAAASGDNLPAAVQSGKMAALLLTDTCD